VDILSIVGVLLAISAILGGNAIEGGELSSLLQLTAFMIVIGGTIGAIMVQTPLGTFLRSLKMALWVVLPPKLEGEALIERMLEWSNVARREGLLGLETLIETEGDDFIKKGLQLLVDGSEPEAVRRMLEVDLASMEHRDIQAAKVFEGLGGYSPTLGILGAVMGLIHVMNNLADPSKLGGGIATAFVATIYGVGSANIMFLPIANKLKAIIHRQTSQREMLIEGLASISEGENPRAIEVKLRGFLH